MNDATMLNLSSRMKNNVYIGVVGSVRSGKSSFINSFFKQMVLPYVDDEFIKHKIIDELPQSSAGKQIMTVEPKFIPSTTLELNVDNVNMNLRFVDCVGEIIPSSEGYGSDKEPRLVKTPWFDEAIPFKEAAQIGTEKVIYNHSNLGIYITSDGTFGDFNRKEYEMVENNLIPKLKELNKPFIILVNTKNKEDIEALNLADSLEKKWGVCTIPINAINLSKEDCNKIITKALDEFPIADLEILLPDYIHIIGDEIEIKKNINNVINEVEGKYKKVKDVQKICDGLRNSEIFSKVTLDILEPSTGKASIILDLDDSKYKEIVTSLLGDKINSKASFLNYLYVSNKANKIYNQINSAILEAKETGYGVSIPQIDDMKLLPPEVVKKNGMYGVKLAAKAPIIHMIAVDLESSFTPIIGSEDQSRMLMSSLSENGEEKIWQTEFFGKKLSDIVNDSMRAKIHSIPEKSKDKIKSVLDRIMNSERNNLIAIIL